MTTDDSSKPLPPLLEPIVREVLETTRPKAGMCALCRLREAINAVPYPECCEACAKWVWVRDDR